MSIPEGEGGLAPEGSNTPATTAYRTAPLPQPPPLERHAVRAAFLTVAWVVGAFVPIPLAGVDGDVAREVLRASASQGVAPEGPLMPLFGLSLSALVTVRAALALFANHGDAERRQRWGRRGAMFYFVCAAAQGLSLALWLESAHTDDGMAVVSTPGWGVRFGAAAASMVSAALAWQLANAITRTRVAHGPMLMLLASMTLHLARGWIALGHDLARDAAPFTSLVTLVVSAAPTALLLVALWRWSPRVWPKRLVREVDALGPFDLVALPLVASEKAVHLAAVLKVHSDVGRMALSAVAGVACAGALASWLRRATPHALDRRALWAAVATPIGAVSIALGAMVIEAHGLPSHLAADLGLGTRATVITLRGESPHPMDDALKIVERLRRLHVRAFVRAVTPTSIALRVWRGEADPRPAIEPMLLRGTLAFYRAADDQSLVAPSGGDRFMGLGTRIVGRDRTEIYEGPTEASLAPVVARSNAVPGAITRVGCDSDLSLDRPMPCYALRLEATPALTERDVESASVEVDPSDGRPTVRVSFTREGAAAFADVTRRSVRHLLAIVVDDRINSAPVVMQEITGGNAVITMGTGAPGAAMRSASALAAALTTGSLEGQWTLSP